MLGVGSAEAAGGHWDHAREGDMDSATDQEGLLEISSNLNSLKSRLTRALEYAVGSQASHSKPNPKPGPPTGDPISKNDNSTCPGAQPQT